MDPSKEIAADFPSVMILYKDGHVERLAGNDAVPPSVDPVTGVASKDVDIDPATGLSARLYLPNLASVDPKKKLPVLVYYHGGAFCIASAFSSLYHDFLNPLVAKAQVVAVSVEYRLAPEHPIPVAYDDSWRALQWVASHATCGSEPWLANEKVDFSRVFLAGDSAGANIAHNMAMRAGREGGVAEIEGAALLHPYFWGTQKLASELNRDDGPFLLPESVDELWPYISGAGNDDPRMNPVAEGAPSLAELGCRRVLVAVAEKDTLRDRGRLYCEGLKKSGWEGEVQLWETEGEDHVFHLFNPSSKNAKVFMELLAGFLSKELE